MSRGQPGVPHTVVKDFIANHPGITVVDLTREFGTTRAAMARRLTDLFAFGEVVKKPIGPAKPVQWFVAGKL
jgi:hypothetical protein